MVHSVVSSRMAAIARLLAPGNISQTITEDVGYNKLAAQYTHKELWEADKANLLDEGYNKLAAQYTHKELWEADEANLLDEDDMHVFGSKPTTDPLNLVCCNACKKPVRASQFATHAELCRSLSTVEEIVPKLDHGTRRKKPPRKERKKPSKVSAGSHGSAPSSSHLNEQMQLTSSSPNETKGNSPCVDGLLMMDGSGVNARLVDRAVGAEKPPLKRSKLLAADSQLILDHLGSAKGVTKNLFLNTQEAFTCEYQNGSKIGNGKTSDHVVGHQMPRQVYDCYIPTRGVPVPLATKIYYSQRDQRLRSAINDLYKASTYECWNDFG